MKNESTECTSEKNFAFQKKIDRNIQSWQAVFINVLIHIFSPTVPGKICWQRGSWMGAGLSQHWKGNHPNAANGREKGRLERNKNQTQGFRKISKKNAHLHSFNCVKSKKTKTHTTKRAHTHTQTHKQHAIMSSCTKTTLKSTANIMRCKQTFSANSSNKTEAVKIKLWAPAERIRGVDKGLAVC